MLHTHFAIFGGSCTELFGGLHLRFRDGFALATSTFVFGDSYTLWRPPPSLSRRFCTGNLRLGLWRQLHALATSTFVFGDSYTLWQPPPSFSATTAHFGNLHPAFDDSYTLWQPPPFSTTVAHFGNLHRFRRQLHTLAISSFRRQLR